jgi:hypothetical protein
VSATLIFWHEPFRATGRCSAETAARRLQSLLATTSRFSSEERLLGRIDGMRFRVWKRTLFGTSADVVQLEAEIAQGEAGAVVEGRFSYKAATKIQFIGLMVLGLLIIASGTLQRLAGTPTAGDILLLGCGISALTATWIVGAYWMRDRQIAFLSAQLEALLGPEAP